MTLKNLDTILILNFSDTQVWANSVHPDQTAPDQSLHCLPFCVNRNDPKFSDRHAWANSADPDLGAV